MKTFPQLKLNATAHSAVVKAIAAGLTRRLCAQSAGISKDTLFSWLRKGRADIQKGKDTKYSRLIRDIRKGEADKAKSWLSIIESAALTDPKHWTAAAWLLERRLKDDYSKREEINQHHSGSIETAAAEAIDERINQLFKPQEEKK